MRQLRIGIDVGGTFTHAVAVDNRTLEVVAHAVTPTTHQAAEGVARGIVDVVFLLMEKLSAGNLPGNRIVFIAHSTTQATNALLEGDVVPVGILALGSGLEGLKAKQDARIPDIQIAPGKMLRTFFQYSEDPKNMDEEAILEKIRLLRDAGSQSIVAVEPFSVEDPANEKKVLEICRRSGIPCCGSFEVSGLLGLRVRTRTAVVNASILPRMLETADLVDASISKAGIEAPLMIMRSDGGVMTAGEMRRRPIFTLLSGPAAGIAAALVYIRASDAIFLEVGGTSTDITAIRSGKAAVRSAVVGGHRTHLKTLDSRTLGIAGGSLVSLEGKKIAGVGPRSAHIAGLPYVSFVDPSILGTSLRPVTIRPRPGDPEYLVLENEEGRLFAITPTCAANFLGLVPPSDYACGNRQSISSAFALLSSHLGCSADAIARQILETAWQKMTPTLQELIREYEFAGKDLLLIGGGGGASALVPYCAKMLSARFEIAKSAEVISAIGAALAMVRETIERNVFNPSQMDILKIGREAEEAVVRMGADPVTVEVQIEVDAQKNIVRALASGSISFEARDLLTADVGSEERRKAAAASLGEKEEAVRLVASTPFLFVYGANKVKKGFLNLVKKTAHPVRVLDRRGVLRLQMQDGDVAYTKGIKSVAFLEKVLQDNMIYSEAGGTIPPVFILYGNRILDLSTVVSSEQIVTIFLAEAAQILPEDDVIILLEKGS